VQKVFNIKRISLVLTVISATLILCGTLTAKFDVGFWGLFESFSPTYYVGIGVMVVSSGLLWFMERDYWQLLLGQTTLLVLALWLVPSIVGSPPGLPMSYRNLFDINNIAENGIGFATSSGYGYLQWVGFQASFAQLAKVIDLEPMLEYYPVFIQLLCLVPLYFFLRNTVGKSNRNYCFAGLVLFTFANWIGHDYFCAQSIGILMFLIILALITIPALKDGVKKTKWLVYGMILLVFGMAVVSHLLTSIVMLLVLLMYCVGQKRWKALPVVGLCIVMIAGWNLGASSHYFEIRLAQAERIPKELQQERSFDMRRTLGNEMVNFDMIEVLETNVLGSMSGSESHQSIVGARIGYSAVFVFIGLVSTGVVLTRRRDRDAIVVALTGGSLCLLLPLQAAGWELMQRLYLFALPFMTYFVVKAVSSTPKTLGTVLIDLLFAISPQFVICRYGNQATDHLSPEYIEGIKKVDVLKSEGASPFILWYQVDWDGERLVYLSDAIDGIHYFAISKHDDNMFTYIHDAPDFVDGIWGWLGGEYQSVWANSEFEIFKGVAP